MVKAYEYTDPIVLACSQELDQFMYLFMRDYSPQKLHVRNDSNSSIELESHYTYVLYILP
ncbi:aspartyl-phosphate phosphatase Spo0E family protein [Bacillus toyonensis]|uniref:aspartyl-phosphate phosphatase Spo0E family protein n=1 Tax=Bacillus toyonensis TaxID=155322 RepID=UPI0021000504|nr:aspartyl-phosphate phosphatase Spo0E family protein [Bacillus toyonensis]